MRETERGGEQRGWGQRKGEQRREGQRRSFE